MPRSASLQQIARRLGRQLDGLAWSTPSHVYNPLVYAWDGYAQFVRRFGPGRGRVLIVGMNPGPWGMAQTGVPFGNVSAVRDWLHIDTKLARALPEQHPRYPILGMACARDEGSGKRLWGWAAQRVGTPEAFFERFFTWNYCPLLFLGEGHNLIPSALSAAEQRQIQGPCDAALEHAIALLAPQAIVALGRYAQQRVQSVVGDAVAVHYLLHPSPANPTANRRWSEFAEEVLGPWLPPAQRRPGSGA
ncbi:MAG: single-stranded DNA-binding protein [Comamonadaceae bacterium]|nr:single-stranded DNA-binding protein [Burkholderiales bacterium]MEB2347480.1 single-stranded DNA-binding protein [Comamonadaceae bacterium]